MYNLKRHITNKNLRKYMLLFKDLLLKDFTIISYFWNFALYISRDRTRYLLDKSNQ